MTTFYIIRHADKEWGDHYNPKLRHQDEPITPTGQAQAQKLVPYFADKGIARIYISAYQRTAQTIAPLAVKLNLFPVADERLNEINNGLFDGMSDEEIRQKFPEELRAFRERKTDFRFPEGETGEEARKRFAEFLEEKRKLHPEENIIAVCHEGLIRILMCHLTNNPVYNRWNFYVDFCGITELTFQPDFGIWKLMRFNQTCV
jgi:broad specificity phosphatase PhoE